MKVSPTNPSPDGGASVLASLVTVSSQRSGSAAFAAPEGLSPRRSLWRSLGRPCRREPRPTREGTNLTGSVDGQGRAAHRGHEPTPLERGLAVRSQLPLVITADCKSARPPIGRPTGSEYAPRGVPEVHQPTARALTLIELLVVVAIIGTLAGMLLPALGRAKGRATGVACLNNLKQLQICWQMYVDDFQGRVPSNRSVVTNGVWRSTSDSWTGSSSAPYDSDAQAIEQSLLIRYHCGRSVALYRCPADKSHVRSVAGRELPLLRTRSYSVNSTFGGNMKEDAPDPPFQTVRYLHQALSTLSQLFVFIDEHEHSIDDGHFLVWPRPNDWWSNVPADRHGRSGAMSFADGHAQLKLWRVAKGPSRQATDADLDDLRWVQERAHIKSLLRVP